MRSALPMFLVRLMIGAIFVLEGLLKILQPAAWGAERFAALGIPWPQTLAPVVGSLEIGGGLALILNFCAGESALLLLAMMIGALISTKFPILLDRPLGPFHHAPSEATGWIPFLHEARLDFAMLLGTLAIAIDSGLRFFRQKEWYSR